MPKRVKADHDEIASVYKETGSAVEAARQLNLHRNTVYQVLRMQAGKCRSCANKVLSAQAYCPDCQKRHREKFKLDRAERLRRGLCTMCDKPYEAPSRQYCDEHRIVSLERAKTSRAKKRKSTGNGPQSDRDRERYYRWRYGPAAVTVFDRLAGHCVLCGIHYLDESVHIHHIDKDRTNNDEENLTLLCQPCHRLVHSVEAHPNLGRALAWIRETYPELEWTT